MTRIALIPVFFGESTAANSPKEVRLGYLHKTIDSLENEFAIVIGVCSDDEAAIIKDLSYTVITLNCDPRYLPLHFCNYAKENFKCDNILLTEADHVFHGDFDLLDNVINNNQYVVPHRIEELYKGSGSNRGKIVIYNSKTYCCPNSGQNNDSEPGYYLPNNAVEGFGGAFYCSKDLFNKVNFSMQAKCPIEHTTGFDIYATGTCLKTNNILEFFVEHLSGYDFHKKICR